MKMKHLTYLIILLTSLMMIDCTDLDEVNHRLDALEDEIESTTGYSITRPKLTSMEFLASANPNELIDNVKCDIIGDSVVECWIHHIMGDKLLTPHFIFNGDSVLADGKRLVSDVSTYDFKAPVKLTVYASKKIKEYTLYVHAFTGLPILWIETEGREEIVSTEDYLNAHFRLVEDVCSPSAGAITEADGHIRGRGNSTWNAPKRPYRLKFDEKVGFLGEAKDKSWVLLANYFDKTVLRNSTAFYLSEISNLDYTPRFHFVEVMLNGQYCGTYQLGDHLKISQNRVNVGDDGFLLEIDERADESDVIFHLSYIAQPVVIKDPDVEVGDDNYNYVKDYVATAEAALFSENFTDPDEGWQKYMDMDSFVDWYLINEIAKNTDAMFVSSCYMNLKRGGKLKMGPIWDFDIAFGNVNYNDNCHPEGLCIRIVSWFDRLFQDPAFATKAKERFMYFYNRLPDIMDDINSNASYLRYSVMENNYKWGTLYNYTWPNYDIWGCYQNEIQHLKNWIQQRFEWLKSEFDK